MNWLVDCDILRLNEFERTLAWYGSHDATDSNEPLFQIDPVSEEGIAQYMERRRQNKHAHKTKNRIID